MAADFTLHQALFGYDSGHHLLAASLNLSADVKHLLAVATDLSGSAPHGGFEATYTGMPLVGSKYYVLFCTWQAPEMPRPGSVWSHVLFIELGDLAQMKDLADLRHLFRRPGEHSVDNYRRTLTISPRTSNEQPWSHQMVSHAMELVQGLYGTPEQPVIVLAPDSTDGERLAFSLWSQQWPKLRRNFRFSTGSFADRGRGQAQFDLQVAPVSSRRLWQRGGEYLLFDFGREVLSVAVALGPPEWIQPVVSDLVFPCRTNFREFLSTYGSDVDHPRSAFSKLAEVYKALSVDAVIDWVSVLELVATLFPLPTDALSVKEHVCNVGGEANSRAVIDRALSTALFLLTSPKALPFEKLSIDLGRFAKELWSFKRDEILDLLAHLVRQSEKPMASLFATSIADSVEPREVGLIAGQRPELLPLILGRNPELAFDEELWASNSESQWRAYEVLDGLGLPSTFWAKLIGTMRPSTSAVPARNLVRKAEPLAMDGAFEWMTRQSYNEWIPTPQWRDTLAQPAASLLRASDQLTSSQLALCAWLVAPETARDLLQSSRPDIQQLARHSLESLPMWLRSHTAFLLTALGLVARDDSGVACQARAFFQVHDELASGQYSGESWLLLAPYLPHLGLWKEWDRCKKLRKAVKQLPSEYAKRVASSLLSSAKSEEEERLARKLFP